MNCFLWHLQMQLRFTVADFQDRLKPRPSSWRPNFLVVGFNEWLDSRSLYLNARHLKKQEGKEYTLTGSLPRGSDESQLAIPALLCFYVVVQQTDKGLQCEQRAAKAIVADCVSLLARDSEAPLDVELKNRLGETVCSFKLFVKEFKTEVVERTLLRQNKLISTASALQALSDVHRAHLADFQTQFEEVRRPLPFAPLRC